MWPVFISGSGPFLAQDIPNSTETAVASMSGATGTNDMRGARGRAIAFSPSTTWRAGYNPRLNCPPPPAANGPTTRSWCAAVTRPRNAVFLSAPATTALAIVGRLHF